MTEFSSKMLASIILFAAPLYSTLSTSMNTTTFVPLFAERAWAFAKMVPTQLPSPPQFLGYDTFGLNWVNSTQIHHTFNSVTQNSEYGHFLIPLASIYILFFTMLFQAILENRPVKEVEEKTFKPHPMVRRSMRRREFYRLE
jgi:hypothetical protein